MNTNRFSCYVRTPLAQAYLWICSVPILYFLSSSPDLSPPRALHELIFPFKLSNSSSNKNCPKNALFIWHIFCRQNEMFSQWETLWSQLCQVRNKPTCQHFHPQIFSKLCACVIHMLWLGTSFQRMQSLAFKSSYIPATFVFGECSAHRGPRISAFVGVWWETAEGGADQHPIWSPFQPLPGLWK